MRVLWLERYGEFFGSTYCRPKPRPKLKAMPTTSRGRPETIGAPSTWRLRKALGSRKGVL